MRKGKAVSMIVAGALLLAIAGMPGCSHEDSAFVTIHLKGTVEEAFRYQKENHSILAKLISWLIPGAYAGATAHTYTYNSIILTVEGPDMDTIEASIPITSLTYTIEVPAGNERSFTAIAYNGTVKNSGAFETVVLQSGEKTSLQLNMLPIPQSLTATSATGSVYLNWNAILNVSGYSIYRSLSAAGPYSMIGKQTNYTLGSYTDSSLSPGTTYYYKVKVYTSTKDGVLCDYKSATAY
jgi:hypothetical protein